MNIINASVALEKSLSHEYTTQMVYGEMEMIMEKINKAIDKGYVMVITSDTLSNITISILIDHGYTITDYEYNNVVAISWLPKQLSVNLHKNIDGKPSIKLTGC